MSRGESECSALRTLVRRVLPALAAVALGLAILSTGSPAWAQIDPPGGGCDPNTPSSCTEDDNLCTIERCNPNTRACESVPVTCEGDGNLCTTEACNPTNGQCETTPVTCTADDNLCTTESCNPANGQCGSAPVVCSPDSNLCTTEACNPVNGQCASTPLVCGADDNLCAGEVCNPSTGQCEAGEGTHCDADDNLCTLEACNPSTGQCESGEDVQCPPDDDLCTTEVCIPATGECEPGPPKSCEEDADPCTTEVCDPTTGNCVSDPANPSPEECGGAICRTPGFWGTHAGSAKAGSWNVTQAVIDAVGSLSVCGQTITSTIVSDDNSALEAICVPITGIARLQLARQLTAAALNCVVSDGDADCSSTALYATLFASCNAVCADSTSSTESVASCIGEIDCLNNGGRMLANGFCQTGTCAGDGETPCKSGTMCGDESGCVPLPGNCHSLALDGYEPTGPAGSSKACNAANKSGCTIVGSGQLKCTY